MNIKYIIKNNDIFALLNTLEKELYYINNEFINIQNSNLNTNEKKSKLAQLNGNLDKLIMEKIDSLIINNMSENGNKKKAKDIRKNLINKAEKLSKSIKNVYLSKYNDTK